MAKNRRLNYDENTNRIALSIFDYIIKMDSDIEAISQELNIDSEALRDLRKAEGNQITRSERDAIQSFIDKKITHNFDPMRYIINVYRACRPQILSYTQDDINIALFSIIEYINSMVSKEALTKTLNITKDTLSAIRRGNAINITAELSKKCKSIVTKNITNEKFSVEDYISKVCEICNVSIDLNQYNTNFLKRLALQLGMSPIFSGEYEKLLEKDIIIFREDMFSSNGFVTGEMKLSRSFKDDSIICQISLHSERLGRTKCFDIQNGILCKYNKNNIRIISEADNSNPEQSFSHSIFQWRPDNEGQVFRSDNILISGDVHIMKSNDIQKLAFVAFLKDNADTDNINIDKYLGKVTPFKDLPDHIKDMIRHHTSYGKLNFNTHIDEFEAA